MTLQKLHQWLTGQSGGSKEQLAQLFLEHGNKWLLTEENICFISPKLQVRSLYFRLKKLTWFFRQIKIMQLTVHTLVISGDFIFWKYNVTFCGNSVIQYGIYKFKEHFCLFAFYTNGIIEIRMTPNWERCSKNILSHFNQNIHADLHTKCSCSRCYLVY